MLRELATPLAIVCHDAGAANHVFAWLAAEPVPCRAMVAGPAARLWAEHFPGRACCASLDEALDGAASVLSGSGWASTLEHAARRGARARGARSIAVVDHWVNYLPRFERDVERVLPDEIWVTDEHALAEARRCFPGVALRQQPNLYLKAACREIAPVEAAGPDVLVVLEPARSDWGRSIAGEFQALDHLVGHLGALALPADARLRLRPHPSDPPGKYDAWIAAQRPGLARLDDAPTLAAAISRCACVVGCESYAMVVALAAQRRVVCMLPPWAPACRLPHAGIERLGAIPAATYAIGAVSR